MSNAITKALDEVRFEIPQEILDAVFIQRDMKWRPNPLPIEHHIENEIIRPRVMVDLNLVGGTEVLVPLGEAIITRINQYTSVYEIPKRLTGGRKIMSVSNITFADPTSASNYGTTSSCQSTQMLQTAQQLLDSAGTIPVTSTARVQLIGENTVMVRDTSLLPANVYMRCIVANEDNMNNLQARYYLHFAQAVVLATKAYIFRNMAIRMDIGELYGGQVVGRFKEIVDGYADANELYRDYIKTKMQKVSLMNDNEQYSRYLTTLFARRG